MLSPIKMKSTNKSRVRGDLCEGEHRRQKGYLMSDSYLLGNGLSNLVKINDGNSADKVFPGEFFKESKCKNYNRRNVDSASKRDGNRKKKSSTVSLGTVEVRELIEKLVERAIGGPLDEITVGRLSTHSSYLAMFEKYHSLLCGELARLGFALHTLLNGRNKILNYNFSDLMRSSLSRLIQQIIEEATALPNIKEILCNSEMKSNKLLKSDNFKEKSYEDILATAILNKVIENLEKRNDEERQVLGGSRRLRRKSKTIQEKAEHEDFSSGSDWSETSQAENLSLTIEERIEEMTTAFEGSDDEKCNLSNYEAKVNREIHFPESGRILKDVDTHQENYVPNEQRTSATELITTTGSWEENWLFQKKRCRSTPNVHHPVPVPMLVPNPSEDFRALVGGVDADDLSDMSDCSDSVLEDMITENLELPENNIAHKSENYENQNVNKITQKIVNNSKEKTDTENKDRLSTRSDEKSNVDEKEKAEAMGIIECNSLEIPRETESVPINWSSNSQTITDCEHLEEIVSNSVIKKTEKAIKCTIADREKEKWNHPISIPDNPYSSESIKKREKRNSDYYFRMETSDRDSTLFSDYGSNNEFSSDKNENSRVSRDFYLNPSGLSSGPSLPISVNRFSKGNDEDSVHRETNRSELHFVDNSQSKIKDLELNESSPNRKLCTANLTLPNVKELAKQFIPRELLASQIQVGLNIKSAGQNSNPSKYQINNEKEIDIDSSPVTTSKILVNPTNASPFSSKNNSSLKQSVCRKEIGRKGNNNFFEEIKSKNGDKAMVHIDTTQYNSQEIHSLTARSISKKFREGLKNSSNYKILEKCVAETEQRNVANDVHKISPTPSIDLKNVKKFWEEIIIANTTLKSNINQIKLKGTNKIQ